MPPFGLVARRKILFINCLTRLHLEKICSTEINTCLEGRGFQVQSPTLPIKGSWVEGNGQGHSQRAWSLLTVRVDLTYLVLNQSTIPLDNLVVNGGSLRFCCL